MARQQNIPGTVDAVDEDLETVAEEVAEQTEVRMRALKKEIELRATLAKMMKDKKRRTYTLRDGRIAELISTTEEKVKVRSPKKRGRPKKAAA